MPRKGQTNRQREAERRRTAFAHAYLANGHNGTAAAREAGYKGKVAGLQVRASQLLSHPKVRAIIDAQVEKAETALELRAAMATEELLRRISVLGTSSIDDFVRFITPEEAKAVIKQCGTDEKGKERAKRVLRLLEGRGAWYLDVEAGLKAGKGQTVKKLKLTYTPEGMPEVELELRDPHPSHALLAKIKGLTRDKDPLPPPPPTILLAMLRNAPDDLLLRMNEELEKAQRAQLAAGSIDVEAHRV